MLEESVSRRVDNDYTKLSRFNCNPSQCTRSDVKLLVQFILSLSEALNFTTIIKGMCNKPLYELAF